MTGTPDFTSAGIAELAAEDERAAALLSRARECAELYLLVSKRRKGCDGMGELAMIKEEFTEAVDALIKHCEGQECPSRNVGYDLERAAAELALPP